MDHGALCVAEVPASWVMLMYRDPGGGFLPVTSSPQNPTLSLGRPLYNKTHLPRYGSDSNSAPSPGAGPSQERLSGTFVISSSGETGCDAWRSESDGGSGRF